MVQQCGRLVSRYYDDKSFDRYDNETEKFVCAIGRNEPPTITVEVTDSSASEVGPDPGTFVVKRIGDTSGTTIVDINFLGTAENGVDYQKVSRVLTFLLGEDSKTITITPIPDAIIEGSETVEIVIVPTTSSDYKVDLSMNTAIVNIGE